MNASIKAEAQRRGITRLCHFTPSRNLGQILIGNVGILATQKLKEDERSVYAPTDLQRMDGFVNHICCTIEYPNAWFFEQARAKEILFKDWVILFIHAKYLWAKGTRFCYRNAAASFGADVVEGEAAFQRMFAQRTVGARGMTFVRTAQRLASCPTDEQAEVLVPDTISIVDIIGVAVQSEEQARNEMVRIQLLKVPQRVQDSLRIIIAPDLFDKRKLSSGLKIGRRPEEKLL
jgi:ssDNA thymidine ADP-ribosyltransferase, DarT